MHISVYTYIYIYIHMLYQHLYDHLYDHLYEHPAEESASALLARSADDDLTTARLIVQPFDAWPSRFDDVFAKMFVNGLVIKVSV